jgi:hypothetical protein
VVAAEATRGHQPDARTLVLQNARADPIRMFEHALALRIQQSTTDWPA